MKTNPNLGVGLLRAGPWILDAMLDTQLYTGHGGGGGAKTKKKKKGKNLIL